MKYLLPPATMIAALALLPAALVAMADDAPKPVTALVTTVDDERISAPLGQLADGKLTLATEPPRTIALADLQRVEFGQAAAAPAATADLMWIGQDNHDLVQVGGASGGNGVQDIHLRATNLKSLALQQVIIVCRFPKQVRVWRLDTSKSPHWRAAVARSGLAAEADLYLEPSGEDAFGRTIEATFTYADGSSTKSSVAAATHTSDQLKVDRGGQGGKPGGDAPAATPQGQAEVFLADGGHLRGEIKQLDTESLLLLTTWKAEAAVPLLRATGVWFGNVAPAGARAEFDKQLSAPAADDVVFLVAPDKSLAQINCRVQSLTDGRLNLRYEDADRSLSMQRVLGIVLAAHPKNPPVAGLFQNFVLASGDSISGQWQAVADGKAEVETAWGARVQIPLVDLAEIRVRNGRLTFLADLEPITIEEVAYFGRLVPWRRDQGFDGSPARLKGKQPGRCLAMHSKSALTFALDGQFEKFRATLGFDDSAGNRGRVACRVLADGRELFAESDLRSTGDVRSLDLDVAGARQLTLEVDFGADEDIGDRILWAEPRLYRVEAK